MVTSCTAARAVDTASATASTVPACWLTRLIGNSTTSPATVRTVPVLLRRLREPGLERADDGPAGLGVHPDGRLDLGRDQSGQGCLRLAHHREDLTRELLAAEP